MTNCLICYSRIWAWVTDFILFDHDRFFHIIIIMSFLLHGFPWLSLATRLSRLSLLAGLLAYIMCPHRAAVVIAGRLTLARPYERIQKRTSLMSLSLLLQKCQVYLIRPSRMVLKMGGKWPYSCCFVGCCFQDVFITARSILVLEQSSLYASSASR